jgi:hypothetical protein
MTCEELEEIVERGVTRAFERLGIDIDNAAESRADFAYLRRSRNRAENAINKVMLTVLGVTLTAALYAFWDSIRASIGHH